VLNHNESILVFKNISAIIAFILIIDPIEQHEAVAGEAEGKEWNNIPSEKET